MKISKFHSGLIIGFMLLSYGFGSAQQIDHWETIVYDSMYWHYWPGDADPGSGWNQPGFDDQAWQQGRGGIGYGDGDDRTEITPVISLFMRKKFNIVNRAEIQAMMVHIDYDDGYVAYLNGIEISRRNIGTGTIPFTQATPTDHEALLYQGQTPESILIADQQLEDVLVAGENTLAIQVHNAGIGSSDLSCNAFLSVGVTDDSNYYLPTPTWFQEPLDFISSNLPIVVINTNQTIPDNFRIVADMGIIDNGPGMRNYLSDPFNHYDGRISIETRGESSQYFFPKKSYGLETQTATGENNNVALLGMPAENDWVLYAPYSDKTMLRNFLAYQLARDLGDYAPRTRFVEVVLNGDYVGVYVLTEKIKRDKNRVDISTLLPEDISGDELTGGYILRVDKIDGNDYPDWAATPSPQLAGENDIKFQYFDPKGDELVTEQRNYIRNYIQNFQSSLTSSGFRDGEGYKKMLDLPSAINFILVNEIGKNIDGFVFSTYLYKEKDSNGGRLKMGPVWDFNLAFGNVDYLGNAQFAPGWMWNDQYRMFWFRRMQGDSYFRASMKCRWEELRSGILTNDYFINKIDSITAVLEESQIRNYQRWPILGTYVWPNQYVGQTYADEINFLKQWILERLIWMDANMPGNCDLVTDVEDDANRIQVFPNPFRQTLTIQTRNPEKKQLHIFNVLGQEVFRTEYTGNEFRWEGNSNSGNTVGEGLYILKILNARGKLVRQVKVVRVGY